MKNNKIVLFVILFVIGFFIGWFIPTKDNDNNNLGHYKVTMYCKEDELTEDLYNDIKISCDKDGSIKINDEEVAKTSHTVDFTIKEGIIIVETSGTDIGESEFYIFNKDLEKLVYLGRTNTNYEENFETITSNITDNRIYIEVSSLAHGPALSLTNGTNLDFSSFDDEQCQNINKYKDLKVERTFYIDYLGNDKIGELNEYSYTTLQEYFSSYYNQYC